LDGAVICEVAVFDISFNTWNFVSKLFSF
jgi:hypothetical protein